MIDPKSLLIPKNLLAPQFGPYRPSEAECLTEDLLGSKGLYIILERLLRGDINGEEFLRELEYAAQTAAFNFHERMREEQGA